MDIIICTTANSDEEAKAPNQKEFEDVINLALFSIQAGKAQSSARKPMQVTDKIEIKDW